MNFRDTGCLNNAYPFEKKYIVALAVYYKLGRYDLSEKFAITYRNIKAIQNYIRRKIRYETCII